MTTLSLTEARADFFELVERAAGGEQITLASRGVPRARLVPLSDGVSELPLWTVEEIEDLFEHHQMSGRAWDAIRFPGDTIGEDGLG